MVALVAKHFSLATLKTLATLATLATFIG